MAREHDSRAVEMVGRRFGRLTVLEMVLRSGPRYWRCECDCKKPVVVKGAHLRSGRTQSCGCYCADRTSESRRTHGRRQTVEYSIWTNMKDRCLNQNGTAYKDWGGRGITICARWRDSFEAFYADMGPRPSEDHELDRRDNNGPYSPENVRWVVRLVQANNKRNNVRLTIGGTTLTVAQWAREAGVVSDFAIHKRLKRGWDAEEAVYTPSRAVRKWGKMPVQHKADATWTARSF